MSAEAHTSSAPAMMPSDRIRPEMLTCAMEGSCQRWWRCIQLHRVSHHTKIKKIAPQYMNIQALFLQACRYGHTWKSSTEKCCRYQPAAFLSV